MNNKYSCQANNMVVFQSMYALMAKCEELSKVMQPIHKLHAHVYPLKSGIYVALNEY